MAAEPASPILFDENRLLSLFGEDPSVIANLLEMFVQVTRDDLVSLAAACERQDAPRVANISHRLKGAAFAVGAVSLRMEAEKLEAAGLSGRLEDAGSSVARLSVELERLSCHVARHP